MPLLHHAVVWAFAGNGLAVQLARQADREVADVDPLLDLAGGFGGDLADLAGDQRGEVGVLRAHLGDDAPHQFAATRRRHASPTQEGGLRRACGGRDLGGTAALHGGEHGAVDRRGSGQRHGTVAFPADGEAGQVSAKAETGEDGIDHASEVPGAAVWCWVL